MSKLRVPIVTKQTITVNSILANKATEQIIGCRRVHQKTVLQNFLAPYILSEQQTCMVYDCFWL
jgi:hypothetical protein